MMPWIENLGVGGFELAPAFRYHLGLEEVKAAGASDTTTQVIAVTNTVQGLLQLIEALGTSGDRTAVALAQAKVDALRAGQTPAQANATAGVGTPITVTPTQIAVGGVATLGLLGAVYYLAKMA